jgi:FkbM family methyltransferase
MGHLRTFVEKMSRNRILLRHLPRDLNSALIYVSPDASLKHWNPHLESDLFDLARQFVQPGDTVWDVGANVGLFTIAAAQRAGPDGSVISIEPDIWLAALLQRTAAAQPVGSAPIQIMQVAVTDTTGTGTFYIANRNRASNHLSSVVEHSQAGGVRETLEVPCITLDWLLEQTPPPTLVKIDVEGSEIDLLHGAHRLLSEVRPILMCESQHRNRPATTIIFKHYGYRLYDWDASPPTEVQTAAFNTLALPIESQII